MGRQRHDNGNPQLLAQMSRAFNIPDAKASTASNGAQAGAFQRFIYLTQVRCAASTSAYMPSLAWQAEPSNYWLQVTDMAHPVEAEHAQQQNFCYCSWKWRT